MAVGAVGAGANMALRRSLPETVGPFDEALDAGTPTRSGGDHEMFARILAAGYRVVYDPAALSWHQHRRTRRELVATVRGYGTGVYAMWTRALLVGGELSVFKHAITWLRYVQLPELARVLVPGRRRLPFRLLLAELLGCLAGPMAYFSSRRAVKRRLAGTRPWASPEVSWRQGEGA
jgi:GT2 family glycosyltransferase